MKTHGRYIGRLSKGTTIERELFNMSRGKRPRFEQALRLAKAGLVTVGAHDGPITLTPLGKATLRQMTK